MKKIVLIALVSFFVACVSDASQNGVGGTIEPIAFDNKLKETANAQLIDVRGSGEFINGHIKDAQNINWNSPEFEGEVSKLDKSKPIFVYCLSGGRSASAVTKLKEMQFKEIYELKGGVSAWTRSDLDLE